MSQNAYEIRHALLNEASSMLFDVWNRKCDAVFTSKTEIRPEDLPPAPTFREVLELAREMNQFVSGA